MADQAKIGSDWQDEELDLILADYFAMLDFELSGEPYVKARHSAALMERIGRTHRSVEFKHMNISAVLKELSLPTIRGYKAKANYQGALVGAVERYLSTHPALDVQIRPPRQTQLAEAPSLFEEQAPTADEAPWAKNSDMHRLVRKFDPAARDARNRALGYAGEDLIVNTERRKLQDVDRPDLARKVRWVSQEDGDGAGFDILSFDPSGRERLIEVKTTTGSRTTPFYLTRNEHELSAERPDEFRLYRLFEFSETPRLFKLRPPLEDAVHLNPEIYRASFSRA